jgi:hypothetical protein
VWPSPLLSSLCSGITRTENGAMPILPSLFLSQKLLLSLCRQLIFGLQRIKPAREVTRALCNTAALKWNFSGK